jgi:hypothetical protein
MSPEQSRQVGEANRLKLISGRRSLGQGSQGAQRLRPPDLDVRQLNHRLDLVHGSQQALFPELSFDGDPCCEITVEWC